MMHMGKTCRQTNSMQKELGNGFIWHENFHELLRTDFDGKYFHGLCIYLYWQWTVSGLRTRLACETHVHNLNYETVTELRNGVQLSRLPRLLLGKLCFASKREETSTVHTISEWLGMRDCWTRSMWRILEWLVPFECLGGAATRTSGLEVSVCT